MLEDCYNYPLDRVKRSWCQHKPKFSTPADQPVWPGDDRLPRGVRWRSAWLDRGEQIFGSKHNQRFLNILPAVNLTVKNLWKNFPLLQFSRTLKDDIYCIFFFFLPFFYWFNQIVRIYVSKTPDCLFSLSSLRWPQTWASSSGATLVTSTCLCIYPIIYFARSLDGRVWRYPSSVPAGLRNWSEDTFLPPGWKAIMVLEISQDNQLKIDFINQLDKHFILYPILQCILELQHFQRLKIWSTFGSL